MTDLKPWPLDIAALPELSQKGACQTGLSYAPQDIEDIQIYGIYRGIEVIIEMDIPRHTTSIAFAYPELITAFLYNFVTKLFDDVLPRLSPYSAYSHTGGDEIENSDYLLDDTVNSKDIAVIAPLLEKFIDHSHDFVRKAGLVPIVWQGLLLTWNITLGKDQKSRVGPQVGLSSTGPLTLTELLT
ncbi:hypothetical protein N7497_003025 [Penicillium chrysogenum]|nr:hypothetical protein N7497_003025 [Penicillium chrysogenum]